MQEVVISDDVIQVHVLPMSLNRSSAVLTHRFVSVNLFCPPAGKQLCLELGFIPVLLQLLVRKSEEDEERRRRRKALTLYTLRALTSLGEAPVGRHILLYQLSLLRERSGAQEEDPDIRQAALTTIRVITRVP